MSEPRSIRFDADVLERLRRFARSRSHLSVSTAASHLIDEALRSDEHPGIVFRNGPAGRRAGLAAGPDIREVVQVLRDVRAAQPRLAGDSVIAETAKQLGIEPARVRIATGYYSAFPTEVDAQIAHADEASRAAEDAWRVEQRLTG